MNRIIPAADHWGAPSILQPGEHAVVWLSYDGITLPPVIKRPYASKLGVGCDGGPPMR